MLSPLTLCFSSNRHPSSPVPASAPPRPFLYTAQFLSSYYYGYIATQVCCRHLSGFRLGPRCVPAWLVELRFNKRSVADSMPSPTATSLLVGRPLSPPCPALQFLGGVAAKRWGSRVVLALGVCGSGLSCCLTPAAAAHSWGAAFFMRVLAGVCEGVVFPCTPTLPPWAAA